MKLDNYLIHKSGCFDTHHEYHNLLHFLYKEFQMHKNVHLQELVDNNNQLQSQNQVKLDNCLFHKQDHLDTHQEHHNLLHFQNKSYNDRNQFLHCFQRHSKLKKSITIEFLLLEYNVSKYYLIYIQIWITISDCCKKSSILIIPYNRVNTTNSKITRT